MSENRKEIVEKVDAAFAQNNLEGFLSFCAEDVEWTIVGERNVKGKESIRQWMATFESEPPRFNVQNVVAEGDFVTAYGDMTLKDKDGNWVPYAYCDIYRFRGDKIAELTSFVVRTGARYETRSA